MKITTRWTTVATISFRGAVGTDQNPAAHGCVCDLQVRRSRDGGLVGRKVNVNGCHQEFGNPFDLDSETLSEWESIARSSR